MNDQPLEEIIENPRNDPRNTSNTSTISINESPAPSIININVPRGDTSAASTTGSDELLPPYVRKIISKLSNLLMVIALVVLAINEVVKPKNGSEDTSNKTA